jgi:hypothetical protein
VEFSNIILLVLALGAAALNPLFDVVAPKIATLFRRRHVRHAQHAPSGCG